MRLIAESLGAAGRRHVAVAVHEAPRQALPILTLVAAFPVVMKSYLRGERDTRRLKALLNAQECSALDVRGEGVGRHRLLPCG